MELSKRSEKELTKFFNKRVKLTKEHFNNDLSKFDSGYLECLGDFFGKIEELGRMLEETPSN